MIYRAFCNPGKDNVIVVPPTYGMYQVCADINDVEVKKVNLTEEFDLNVIEILRAVDDNTKVIWVCSPNNPTGNKVTRSKIFELLENFKGLVIVDEAYIDFSDEPSFIQELEKI